MKDSEFIELLNLYLDHEITPADATRLEAEVQRNPERRRVYQQYCRMQKACTLLAQDFNEQAAAVASELEGRKVVAFEPRRFAWGPGIFAIGGLAAAACVALVLLNRTTEPAPASPATPAIAAMQTPAASVAAPVETQVIVASSESVATHANIARTVTVPVARRSELQPVLATRSLALGGNAGSGENTASAELAAQFDWIARLQIAPVQRVHVEDLRFEARPAEPTKNPTYGSRHRPAQQGVVEMTAFQFQK